MNADRAARRAKRDAEWARRDAEAEQRARLDARIDAAAAAAPSVLPGGVGEALAAVLEAMKPFRAADGYLAFSAVGRTSDEVVTLAEAVLAVPADAARAATGQARETGADWAARPRRFSPEDALSVAERLGAAEPQETPALVDLRARIAAAFAGVDNFAGEPPTRDQLDWAHIAACVALKIGQAGPSGGTVQASTAEIAGWDGAA